MVSPSTSAPSAETRSPPLSPAVYSTQCVQRFRGGLVCKAHRLCVSINSRLESNKDEKKEEALTTAG